MSVKTEHLTPAEVALTLDTSGCVRLLSKDAPWKGLPKPDIYWTDLSLFVQGYIEALLLELEGKPETRDFGPFAARFQYLSPAALALILKDCAEVDASGCYERNERGGALYWRDRQAGAFNRFPPYVLSLNDDGKVLLAVAS